MRPTAVAVVVPARDEETLLPACLDSISHAAARLALAHPDIEARVFVVLDSCRDGTEAVVAARADATDVTAVAASVECRAVTASVECRAVAASVEFTAVAVQAGCVGAARSAGVDAAAEWAGSAGSLWVANTDADSEVPGDWLLGQVAAATAGHELVVGTVHPLPGDLSAAELATWWSRHSLNDGHDHVHGANLGFSLAAYRSVGGFLPLQVHEDVCLVAALREAGVSAIAPGGLGVRTSGRRRARAPDGFAAYLDSLGA